MKSLVPIAFAVLALSACKKDKEESKDPLAHPERGREAAESKDAKPAGDAGPTDAEKVAKALAESETKAAEEQKRWTPELTAKAVALRDGSYKDSTEALTAILASEHRTPGHIDRDPFRHPVETLTFFGIEPTMTVVELGAGGGWYTELLAPLLAAKGKLIVAGPDTAGPKDKMSSVYGRRLDLFLAKSPELFGKVERRTIKPDAIELAAPGSADMVIAMREMHGMVRRDELDKYLAAVHAALEDGGIFGVEQHRAKEGTNAKETAENGYLPEAFVIEKVTAAGFELVEKSEIDANPKDTKDYEKGVWTLPPNYAAGETDKAKYTEIGESDRMTLKFKKVAKK